MHPYSCRPATYQCEIVGKQQIHDVQSRERYLDVSMTSAHSVIRQVWLVTWFQAITIALIFGREHLPLVTTLRTAYLGSSLSRAIFRICCKRTEEEYFDTHHHREMQGFGGMQHTNLQIYFIARSSDSKLVSTIYDTERGYI